MSKERASFYVFRYQILPVDRSIDPDFLDGVRDVDQLLSKKNELFREAMASMDFSTQFKNLSIEILYNKDEFTLYRISVARNVKVYGKDTTTKDVTSWPWVLAAIWNDPNKQIIAVQKRSEAFQTPATIPNVFIYQINKALIKRQLVVEFEPLYDKNNFWDIVRENKGRVCSVEFEFITPNMANLSSDLSEDLKDFAKQSNSIRNKLRLEASEKSSLNLNEDNRTLGALVDYTSGGGGSAAFKLRDVTRRIKTNNAVKEVHAGEIDISGDSKDIVDILKAILP